MRILFVSDEVAPFNEASWTARLTRLLPEQLQESGDYEVRIMMPRYGIISERRNRLHEVIRLSGTNVRMGTQTETLKVKVASIPGIRMQVYFMDNNAYFKRKGVYRDKSGKLFEDNPARALFFGRSALATIGNLGWSPDVVHACGWMSSLVPLLLRTELSNDPLFENTRVLYSPNEVDFEAAVDASHVKAIGLPEADRAYGLDPNDIGIAYADAVLYGPDADVVPGEALKFSGDEEEMMKEAAALYEQVTAAIAA